MSSVVGTFLYSSNFANKLCGEWVLSTSVCGTGSFSAHTATHSISGNAHEMQNFSTELQKTKKCQRTLDTNDFKVKFDFPPASLYNIQYTTRKGYPL